MPWYYSRAEMCPPDDKPWLISARRDLAEDDENNAHWKSMWGPATQQLDGKSPSKHLIAKSVTNTSKNGLGNDDDTEDSSKDDGYGRIVYPGCNATHGDKTVWAGKVHKFHHDDFCDGERCFGEPKSGIPKDPRPLLGDILYDSCPQKVDVQVLVSKQYLDIVLDTKDTGGCISDVDKFFSSKYLRSDAPTDKSTKAKVEEAVAVGDSDKQQKENERRLAAFREWLRTKAQTGTSVHRGERPLLPADSKDPSVEDDLVLVACKRGVDKSEHIEDVLSNDVLDSLGIDDGSFAPTKGRTKGIDLTVYFIQDKIGQHIHFPEYCHLAETASSMEEGSPSHAVAVTLSFDWRHGDAGPPKSALLDEVRARKKATDHAFTCRLFVKGDENQDADGEDGRPITYDNTHVVWLPVQLEKDMVNIYDHCHNGKGETESIKRRLEKGNTDTGNLKVAMFESEFEYVKQLRCEGVWSRKLCLLLSLADAMVEQDYWMLDNERPENVRKLLKGVAQYLRTKILVQNDETLGIGIPGDAPEVRARSREGIYAWLDMCADGFKRNDSTVNFNCVPGRRGLKRKRS